MTFVNPACIQPEQEIKVQGKPSDNNFHIEDLFLNLKTFKLEDPTNLGLSILDLCLIQDDEFEKFQEDTVVVIETVHLANKYEK